MDMTGRGTEPLLEELQGLLLVSLVFRHVA
jgi:hypothetical protein